MSNNGPREERARLRELAAQTLEAYRNLNSVAASAAYAGNSQPNREGLARAGELLEAVIAELKGTVKTTAG
jgi:hypothetical protein